MNMYYIHVAKYIYIYTAWFVPTLLVKQIGECPIVQCWSFFLGLFVTSPSVISALEESRVLKKGSQKLGTGNPYLKHMDCDPHSKPCKYTYIRVIIHKHMNKYIKYVKNVCTNYLGHTP